MKLLEPKYKPKYRDIATYIYLGIDERVVKVVYKLKDKTTESLTLKELPLLKLKHVQLIFDAEILSYREIIRLMMAHQGHDNTFRIKPKNCDFILGSDNSTSKGEVLPLTLEANN